VVVIKDRMGQPLSGKDIAQKSRTRIANIWLDFVLMVLACVGYIPFHSVRKFFYRAAGMQIGKGSTIHMWARFFNPQKIEIGEDSIIGDHAFLDGRAKLKIGDHVDIASQVLIYNSQHDVNSEDFHAIEEAVEIGDYVFIGPRVIILPGVTIGRGAVVGAGAVVIKNIPEFAIVGGVPAEVIGERKLKDLHYRLGRARLFQ